MKKKQILITGAAGFIGFHVAKKLKENGHFIVGYDNFNSYYSPLLKRARAAELKSLGIDVIEGDILNESLLLSLVEQKQISHCLHLAAQAGVRYSLTNPKSYLKSNVDGFLNILELCRAKPHIKLTYASSSSVYGLNHHIPYSIGDRTDRQASLYGVTKKTNELMAQTYHHLFGIAVTGLRFFTVYGPWGRPDMAYFSFTKAILEERPVTIYNNGQMRRDFTYIDDIVEGVCAAIDKESSCALYNLGHHQPQNLMDLICLLEKHLKKQAIKEFLPMQPGDVVSTYADIEKSQQELNFYPKICLEDGIKNFLQWYRAYFSV